MNSAHFSVNDLLRRKLQTSLTITTLTLSVASTLFLLLFSNRLGIGIAAKSETLTLGLTALFGQFILFIGVLIFAVGAVLTSFIVFLMMAQRTRDFGLIKAAGCPNSLVGGYFMTELLTVTLVGCILGVVFGFLADFAVANVLLSSYQVPNFWFAPLVFAAFFVLSIFFGLRPILKASKMSAVEALSLVNYYGITATGRHKALSKSALTWRIATRSLFRRQSASIRIIILLSIVFILLTISIAGGIIASGTTTSWVQKTVDRDAIAIAYASMSDQYKLLLSKFSDAKAVGDFDYSQPSLIIPEGVIAPLKALPSVSLVDSRLVLKEHVKEVSNFTVNPETLETLPVGDSREAEIIVIGVNTQNLTGEWSLKGRFLNANADLEAVIGDSVSHVMYSPQYSKYVVLSDPFVEGIDIRNRTFQIVGVCVDPLNNGLVAYVPLDTLGNITGIANPNLLLLKLNDSADRDSTIQEIRSLIQAVDPNLSVFELDSIVDKNTVFYLQLGKQSCSCPYLPWFPPL